MPATDPTAEQTERRPMSYAGAADPRPCEGRHAPLRPPLRGKNLHQRAADQFWRTAAEKAESRAKAEAAGMAASTLLREALGLTEARRGGRRVSDQLLRWIDL